MEENWLIDICFDGQGDYHRISGHVAAESIDDAVRQIGDYLREANNAIKNSKEQEIADECAYKLLQGILESIIRLADIENDKLECAIDDILNSEAISDIWRILNRYLRY